MGLLQALGVCRCRGTFGPPAFLGGPTCNSYVNTYPVLACFLLGWVRSGRFWWIFNWVWLGGLGFIAIGVGLFGWFWKSGPGASCSEAYARAPKVQKNYPHSIQWAPPNTIRNQCLRLQGVFRPLGWFWQFVGPSLSEAYQGFQSA